MRISGAETPGIISHSAEGIVTKMQDNLIIGGDSQEDMACNYICII